MNNGSTSGVVALLLIKLNLDPAVDVVASKISWMAVAVLKMSLIFSLMDMLLNNAEV